jgi:hypothetical protein
LKKIILQIIELPHIYLHLGQLFVDMGGLKIEASLADYHGQSTEELRGEHGRNERRALPPVTEESSEDFRVFPTAIEEEQNRLLTPRFVF